MFSTNHEEIYGVKRFGPTFTSGTLRSLQQANVLLSIKMVQTTIILLSPEKLRYTSVIDNVTICNIDSKNTSF